MRILIDNGDIFDGDECQLQDCFGIGINELESFCISQNMSYEIKPYTDLKREDIGNCCDCGADSKDVKFFGILDNRGICSHFKSDDGWWLRIDHKFDIFAIDNKRLPDVVGELLCPECLEKYNKRLENLFDEVGI